MEKRKFDGLILSLILLISVFAINIVFAQEDDSTIEDVEEEDILDSDEVEVEEEIEDETVEELEDVDEPEEVEEAEKRAVFWLTHVTIGTGFVMSENEENAEFFRGTWVVKRLIEKTEESEDAEKKEIKTHKFGSLCSRLISQNRLRHVF